MKRPVKGPAKEAMVGFLEFVNMRPSESGKTCRWAVVSHGVKLGDVAWYGPWRRYCFFTQEGTVFDAACTRELGTFLEARTADHKAAHVVAASTRG